MNIQVFNVALSERTVAIDMDKVHAIYDVNATTFTMKNGKTIYKIDAMLNHADRTENDFHVSVSMTHEELKEQMAFQQAPIDKDGHSSFEYTDAKAMELMCRYWRDIQDTPLTKAMGIRKIGRVEA